MKHQEVPIGCGMEFIYNCLVVLKFQSEIGL